MDKEFAERIKEYLEGLGFKVYLFYMKEPNRSDRRVVMVNSKMLFEFLNRDWRSLVEYVKDYPK